MSCGWSMAIGFVLLCAVPAPGTAQPLPAASGRVIEAADGDVVVVPREARVTIVTRAHVQARLVYVAAQRSLLLISDPAFGAPPGMPDAKSFHRWQMTQPWPLEARWEGSATIDEYTPSPRGPSGLAIHTDKGTIYAGPMEAVTVTPPPVVVVRAFSSSSRMARGSFDDIEQAWLAGGDDAVMRLGPGARFRMQTSSSAVPGGVVSEGGPPAPAGGGRGGGDKPAPIKTRSADPVYPQTALNAGIQGVVILEITIDTDGAVSNARVLRSIPLLDQAALDAVRQWRYEPTLLNGAPVPVIMTATVNFALQPRTP